MIVPVAFEQLVSRCAPSVGPRTMAALVAYESGFRPYAIGDNTVRRSYFPGDASSAASIAATLLRRGHNIDVGYAQINSANFATFGLSVTQAFDPCTNVGTASSILRSAYLGAARFYGAGQTALAHALSAYNTGGYWAGLGYARGVYAVAATLARAGVPAGRAALSEVRDKARAGGRRGGESR